MAKLAKPRAPEGRVGVNVSMSPKERTRFEAAAAKMPGRLTFSQFVRIALEEKIDRDGLDKPKG